MTKYLSFLLIFICFFEIYGQGIILRRVPLNRNVKDFHSIRLVPGFHFKATENRYFHAMIVKNPSEEHFHMPSKIIDNLINNSCSKKIPLVHFSIPNDTYVNKLCFNYDEAGNYSSFYNCGNSPKSNTIKVNNDDFLFITPNPTTGQMNISWNKSMESSLSEIQIISPNGTKFSTIKLNENIFNKIKFNKKTYNITYNISNYQKGIYFIVFFFENGKKITKKIIKL